MLYDGEELAGNYTSNGLKFCSEIAEIDYDNVSE